MHRSLAFVSSNSVGAQIAGRRWSRLDRDELHALLLTWRGRVKVACWARRKLAEQAHRARQQASSTTSPSATKTSSLLNQTMYCLNWMV
jgi:hypothetical protein